MNAVVSDQPSVLWVLEQKVEKAWADVRSPINTYVDSFLRAWKENHPYDKRNKTQINTINACGMWAPSYPERSTQNWVAMNVGRRSLKNILVHKILAEWKKSSASPNQFHIWSALVPSCWLSNGISTKRAAKESDCKYADKDIWVSLWRIVIKITNIIEFYWMANSIGMMMFS